jgi:hypothetical protein
MFRHGDVIILDPVPLPVEVTKRELGVVAEGEVTGHAHRLIGGEVWESADGQLAIVAKEGAVLTHEEHAHLALPVSVPGEAYPIIIQREYDDEKEWRQVAD